MLLLELFMTFLMIGFISFGGGYAMITVIETEVTAHGWMTAQQFTDVIAIAGMSPGPIATNCAIFVGFHTAGLPGSIIATLGMVLPSLLIILVIAKYFFRFHENKYVKYAFYGLRPIIAGLIAYSAVQFAISNNLMGDFSWHTFSLVTIFGMSLFALIRLHVHPIVVLVVSGVLGVVLYS